jgi:secernin
MCDTLAAMGTATATGTTIFAKNSDRERNEAQFLDLQPRRRYGRGAALRATYIAIPQAAVTHAVLLSRPFWIWGAEIGANEHGVVIGNEAVHPRQKPQQRAALIGMDLLRLGLECGASAAEAVNVITSLLEAHGQGGSCGHLGRRYYDNSFIVADARDAFVLETVGRHWAVRRIDGVGAISNTYSIGSDMASSSAGLQDFARAQGWWDGAGIFDFAGVVTNPAHPGLQVARDRQRRSTERLASMAGGVDAATMMAILRDHGADGERADWHPQDIRGATICMHAGDRRRRGQSVGSMVSDLRAGDAIHWVTGSSAPCTGVFKPVFLDSGLPEQGPRPGDQHDSATLWWRHEALHRALLGRDAPWPGFARERDAMEQDFAARAEAALHADTAERRRVTEACWREADEAEARWLRTTTSRNAPATLRRAYTKSWQVHSELACTEVEEAFS